MSRRLGCTVLTAFVLMAGFLPREAVGVPVAGRGGPTSTTSAARLDRDAELEGEESPLKDIIGGGILVLIVASAAIGLARSSRRLR